MRIAIVVTAVTAFSSLSHADLLPRAEMEVGIRMRENPSLIDRVESLCRGKKSGQDCQVPGSPLSGGGPGVCERNLNRETRTIDLICRVDPRPVIQRQLPGEEIGFVHDATLCAHPEQAPEVKLQCTPLANLPTDVFCAGKAEGSACMAEVSVGGQPVQSYPGTCSRITSRKGFYYRGKRTMTREEIICQGPTLPEPRYETVGWFDKLFQ